MSANMNPKSDDGRNRRESFRIDDTVSLRIRALDDESLDTITSDFNAFRLRYGMKSHIQNQKEVRKPKLIRIKKSNPDIAEYLESLEVQITQLAERLDQSSDVSGDSIEFTCRANLSATGIRFRTDQIFSEGQTFEISMELSTENTQVVMLGEILRVEPRDENKYALSLHYSHIHPEDTEAIVRHLAKLQQMELQARRGLA